MKCNFVLNAVEKKQNFVSKSLWWCMKSEYLFLTKKQKGNLLKIVGYFLISPTFRVNVYVSWMRHSKNIYKKWMIRNHLEVWHAFVINPKCVIGCHFRVEHPVGVVIGEGVKIGNYVKIFQNVTLGIKDNKYPTIGNNVTIYAGAVIIGDVTVGDNSIIGANAVVLKDVPSNSIAVGVPAKIIF